MKTTIDNLARDVQQNLDAQATAYKRSLVRTLNRAAGIHQDDLLKKLTSTFRAPVPFTTRKSGYKLTLARASMDEPFSKFNAKQAQSNYLKWVIEGGERHPGDAGSSDKWIFQPTRSGKHTASGSLQRYYKLALPRARRRP